MDGWTMRCGAQSPRSTRSYRKNRSKARRRKKTEVRVAYDKDKLYFGIYAHYADVGIAPNRSDRNKLDNDDTVTIILEPFLDYLRRYTFAVNGYGVQSDSMIVVQNAQSSADGNLSFQRPVLFRRSTRRRWLDREIAIPIKSLRHRPESGEAHRWGLPIRHQVKSRDEIDVWATVSRNDPNFLGQIGMLAA